MSDDSTPDSSTSSDGARSDTVPSDAVPSDGMPSDAESTHAVPSDGASESSGSEATAKADGSKREQRRREKAAKPKRKAPWWELPALIVLAIGIAIVVKSLLVQPFYIPSDSMEKTLHGCTGCSGDRILVNKLIFDFRDPHPGDIVVFHDPKAWSSDEPISRPPSNPVLRAVRGFGQLIGFVPPDGEILVKRVIAVGGETVKGNAAGVISISDNGPNGTYRTLSEPFVYAPRAEYIDGRQEQPFGPVTIPKGRLWVMGDHRTDSADSRYHCENDVNELVHERDCNPMTSTVPVSNVIGKAAVIAWPPSRWRTLGTPSTFKNGVSASSAAVPGALAMGLVAPVGLLRRRRRRRSR